MKKPNEVNGNCALCGKSAKLTFEHIPPKCAFNNKLIYVQGYDHLSNELSPLYGRKSRSNKGFGKHSLCSSCNNCAGDWYVKDFCEFVKQGLDILKISADPNVIRGEYIFKPLNVLKQILMMFISADTSGVLRSIDGIASYLMNKENTDFPEKLRIFLYSNASPFKRMVGYSMVVDFDGTVPKYWSEINYQPFGYFLTYDSPPPNKFMTDITLFKDTKYDIEVVATVTTAYLKVSSPLMGLYDNLAV
jgi:hypothetical protein